MHVLAKISLQAQSNRNGMSLFCLTHHNLNVSVMVLPSTGVGQSFDIAKSLNQHLIQPKRLPFMLSTTVPLKLSAAS